MPGIPAQRPGHRAGRTGSLRTSLLPLVLVPCAGLAVAWGYAGVLLLNSGQGLAFALGTAAVAAVLAWSLVQGRRTAQALTARVDALREITRSLAETELPGVVRQIEAGESVPAPTDGRAARRSGGDEIQQVAEAVDAVRRTAVAAIVQQAQSREGTKKVFLNIARRTQVLIHRQITMLDELERRHEEPELLKELFAVDHLATRMRRNAENLVVLGGALPARRWRNAVPMVNVLRSAVSETENYARVVVQGVPRTALAGQAVADVIHLVAELIENGTTFSPPYTQVLVSAQEVPKGLAVEVEDRGLGMSEEEYERLNAYLADPPELDVAALGDDLRLGLFVVSRLAGRHDIQVALRPSPYGGTRAVVLVPSALLEAAPAPAGFPGLPFGARVTEQPAARPAGGLTAGASIPGLPGAVVSAVPFRVPTAPERPPVPAQSVVPAEPAGATLPDAALPDVAQVAERAVHEAAPEARELPPRQPQPPALPAAGAPFVRPAAALPAAPDVQELQDPQDLPADGELRTPKVLPKRVRNASLADQLREAAAAERTGGAAAGGGTAAARPARPAPEEDPSPQRSRATMAAIQRGTRTARDSAPPQGSPAGAPAETPTAPDHAPAREDQP
ncbi:sensor histidine kinase [Kitasatospora sp. DSM 101779]|uniref:sensor histidine kinase n=1 Tax=Kitasatospora sp. DSM 101779 TaxID=2853165 RepID=UPI0021D994D0|nr:ATP-binding protein [Kitasatospora sp. DSM 101779]MCU7821973.1 ATP-binding protein [Kitasatospora sp. DSM 101779]